jgi:hypothetical protein
MLIARALNSLRSIAVGLLVMMLLVAPLLNVLSHAPVSATAAEQQRHASLEPVSDQQDHSHDDGEPSEQRPGHTHSHTTADHTHDTASPGLASALSRAFTHRSLASLWNDDARPGPTFRLERPPRTTMTT